MPRSCGPGSTPAPTPDRAPLDASGAMTAEDLDVFMAVADSASVARLVSSPDCSILPASPEPGRRSMESRSRTRSARRTPTGGQLPKGVRPLGDPHWVVPILLLGLTLLLLASSSMAEETDETVGDVLPFRILYGSPKEEAKTGPHCAVWSEGGRLHVRFQPGDTPQEVSGEIRATPDGILKDAAIDGGSPRLRQPFPSLLQFDFRTGAVPEGFSVVMTGDIDVVRIDLRVEGDRRADILQLGERAEIPRGLPAELALKGIRADWFERFGLN